jgi:hypothetical protein
MRCMDVKQLAGQLICSTVAISREDRDRALEIAQDWNVSFAHALGRLVRAGIEVQHLNGNKYRSFPHGRERAERGRNGCR